MTAPVPTSVATRAALTAGTIVAVACFGLTVAVEAMGHPHGGGDAFDLPAVVASAAALEAWGWATLGTFAVVATPALALVATALEYAAVADRRTPLMALGVLAILGVSLAVALTR